ncbi:hypothetical protein DDI_0255 [Dickeya dianthicola RNS04.9]|nr:hypothetical protein DDI_0255 [Dickeya dianthicola RNS04.9]
MIKIIFANLPDNNLIAIFIQKHLFYSTITSAGATVLSIP